MMVWQKAEPKYKQQLKDLAAENLELYEKQALQAEALASTLKTVNAQAQSAIQQVSALTKEIAIQRKAIDQLQKKLIAAPDTNGDDSEETEEVGE